MAERDAVVRERYQAIYDKLCEKLTPEQRDNLPWFQIERVVVKALEAVAGELRAVKQECEQWKRCVVERNIAYSNALPELVEVDRIRERVRSSGVLLTNTTACELHHALVALRARFDDVMGRDPSPRYIEGVPHWERPCLACRSFFMTDCRERFCERCRLEYEEVVLFQLGHDIVVRAQPFPNHRFEGRSAYPSERVQEIAIYAPRGGKSESTAELLRAVADCFERDDAPGRSTLPAPAEDRCPDTPRTADR